MVTKVLSLINGRLKFLYRKQNFLTYSLPTKERVSQCICVNVLNSSIIWHRITHQKFSIPHTVGTIHTCLHITKISRSVKVSTVKELCLILVQKHGIAYQPK